jgi:hypothetical protein
VIPVTFRPLPVWPHERTAKRRGSGVFSASWQSTLKLLDYELGRLDARGVVVGAGFEERDLRRDGWPRSDARTPSHPGVELSFDSRFGRLVYATDVHEPQYYSDPPGWQANLRAIALGLEALRAVDRYGVTKRGEQYAGWKALPAMATGGMTPMTAADIIRKYAAGHAFDGKPTDPASWKPVYRAALKATHPDKGGSADAFRAVQEAGKVLGVA